MLNKTAFLTFNLVNICIYLFIRFAQSESLNVVLFYICNMQNAYNPKPNNVNDYFIIITILFYGARVPLRTAPPQYRGFTITPRHTTLGRTPLDE